MFSKFWIKTITDAHDDHLKLGIQEIQGNKRNTREYKENRPGRHGRTPFGPNKPMNHQNITLNLMCYGTKLIHNVNVEHQSFTQCQQMFMHTEVKNSKETVASANSMTGTSICTWYGATKNANNQGESTLHRRNLSIHR